MGDLLPCLVCDQPLPEDPTARCLTDCSHEFCLVPVSPPAGHQEPLPWLPRAGQAGDAAAAPGRRRRGVPCRPSCASATPSTRSTCPSGPWTTRRRCWPRSSTWSTRGSSIGAKCSSAGTSGRARSCSSSARRRGAADGGGGELFDVAPPRVAAEGQERRVLPLEHPLRLRTVPLWQRGAAAAERTEGLRAGPDE